jgi:hypothetical protein
MNSHKKGYQLESILILGENSNLGKRLPQNYKKLENDFSRLLNTRNVSDVG